MRALMSRRLPHGLELRAVTITTIGLAVFLVASDPSDGKDGTASWLAFAVTITGMAIAAMFSWLSSRVTGARRRAGLLGVTAGVMFGVVAGLVKIVIDEMLAGGVWGMVGSWPLWLLLACGATGIISNQRAYRIASLSASLPVLNIVDVVVALVVGLIVFEQIPAHSPMAIALQLLALAAVAFGLRGLANVEEEQVEEEAASADR
jgi:drug/metabolite transporter (DMT)-like permease